MAINSLRNLSPESARWQMLFSMAVFGTLGFFSRYTSAITSAELSFYRSASAFIIIGIYFLCRGRQLSWRQLRRDVGLMFVSGIALAVNWLFMFEAFRFFYQFGIAAVVMLPYTAWGEGFHLLSLDAVGWSALAIICLIHTVIMHYAYFQALGQLTGQEVAVLGYIDPLVAVVISYFLLHENMTFSQALGGAMILGFAFWNECKGSKDLQGA